MADSKRPELIALDRASVRNIDADGRMHIAKSNISKATVNPYYGREIPDFEKLKLDPERVYYMLRDPDELAKAASTFNNLPILSKHMPVNADAPAQDLVIGSTGTDAVFEDPYLRNSAVVWVQDEIDDIENESKREWSCGYRYEADMTPGKYKGLRFDGIMRNIVGNHLALVHEGRAGPDVIVADSLTEGLNTMAKGKKISFKVALDEGIDVDDVTKLIGALNGVQGAEVAEDDEDDTPLDDNKRDDDAPPAADDDSGTVSQILSFLEGKLSDEDAAELAKLVSGAADEDPDADGDGDKDDDNDGDGDKPAMDAATVRRKVIAEVNAIQEARELVFPHVGKVKVAMDSAASIYKLALDAAGVATKGVHPSAFRAMVEMLPAPGSAPRKTIAQDSAQRGDFYTRFPEAKR